MVATGLPPVAGAELAPLEIPITRTLIVAGALASRDHQEVHHDHEAAMAKGSPDIFMNILTTNGLVGRYITDRLGEAAVLRRVAIRLGTPNHPGDTMVLRGTVVSVTDRAADRAAGRSGATTGAEDGAMAGVTAGVTAEVRVVGTNTRGTHVTGTITVTVPAPPAPSPVPASHSLSPAPAPGGGTP
ncbi:MaoC/PaaZ C-terminal domain-containing protein [Streptomyces sp. NPDC000594]|uniref:MaoC/PaaZ C-terminal domain-containing protein n=1 Tax=Streptomyces sp. NPDC000594 TaxID=3154261 RepID=UPI00331771EB